jgi:membrane protein
VSSANPSVAAGAQAGWQRLSREVGRRGFVPVAKQLAAEFAEHRLLVFASAIAFQTLLMLVPLTLFLLAVLGFLGLAEVWTDELAPEVRERTSPDAFAVLDRTVRQVLTTKQGTWLTVGAALTVWETASAVRTVAGALDTIDEVKDERARRERLLRSLVLAPAVVLCLVGATLSAQVLPRVVDRSVDSGAAAFLALLAGWALAGALLLLVVALLFRFAPSEPAEAPWVGLSSLLVVGSWAVASAAFGFYATTIASYDSLFGALALVFILLVYLYVSSIAFLFGAQLDGFLRELAGREKAGG